MKNNTLSSGRGFDDYYDEHHHETTTTAKPMKQGRYTDPWAGYYDWIINEGSFKFWSVFQVNIFFVFIVFWWVNKIPLYTIDNYIQSYKLNCVPRLAFRSKRCVDISYTLILRRKCMVIMIKKSFQSILIVRFCFVKCTYFEKICTYRWRSCSNKLTFLAVLNGSTYLGGQIHLTSSPP